MQIPGGWSDGTYHLGAGLSQQFLGPLGKQDNEVLAI